MKGFLLLLLCLLPAGAAWAQGDELPALLDSHALLTLGRLGLVVVGLYLLCRFVLAAVKLLLTYLLKRQMLTAATPAPVVAQLLPSPTDDRKTALAGTVRWVCLLTSTGLGLTLCRWAQPLGLHSVIILLFSTALGLLAYYLFLRRQSS